MAELPELPDGQEWVLAEAIQVGDILPGADAGGLNTEVRRVEVKPRTVWITGAPLDDERTAQVAAELGVPLGMALMQRQRIRPSRDTMLARQRQ